MIQLFRDIANNTFIQTVFGISIAILCIGSIYFLVSISGPTGKFYVERRGTYTKIISPDCQCPEPKRKEVPCFEVITEVRLGEDTPVSNCFESKDDAYKEAAEYSDKWRELNGR